MSPCLACLVESSGLSPFEVFLMATAYADGNNDRGWDPLATVCNHLCDRHGESVDTALKNVIEKFPPGPGGTCPICYHESAVAPPGETKH